MSMDFILNLIIGFVLGILSSMAFWYGLLLVRPSIQISPVIAFDIKKERLRIKIINRSRRYAKDIRARLVLAERTQEGKVFKISVFREVPLRRDTVFALSPIQYLYKPWYPPTIYVFSTKELNNTISELSSPTKGDRRLRFTLMATDALSGATTIQTTTYRSQDIKIGGFID
jgi:hypothetical protein